MMKEQIIKYCRELRLGSRMSEEYQQIEAETHEEFLLKLLAIEVGHREVARTNRLIKNANFDIIKTYENYDFTRVSLPSSIDLTTIRTGSFIEAKQEGRLAKFLKTIEKADLLICDEWGFLPLSQEGAQLLFQVVSACYERKSLILTTNLEFSKWSTIFYDEKLTAALIDRLVHHSHLIAFQGPSYRYQHSSINL